MIINNKFKGVVKLTSDQYQELKTIGYIVIDGKKYEYDPYSTLYMTDSMVTAVLYTPQELTEEQKLQARTNIGAGTSNFSGSYNDLTDKPEVGEPIAEAIRDNTVQIINANGGLQLGNSNTESDGIAIGQNARAKNAASLALGYGSEANTSSASGVYTAIGYNAKTSGANSIQLGSGTNYKKNTLQIYNDNIYNHSTHTATFQNLQIGGVDEYPTLSGADAPTTTTVGKVKQFYVETTTPALYYCSSITGTGTTEDPYVYNWTQAGGADEELRNNIVQIESSTGLYIGGATKKSTDIRNVTIGKQAKTGNNSVATTAVGYNTTTYGAETTAIGVEASATSSGGTAIGSNSRVTGPDGIAIGSYAKASQMQSIQLGQGTNSTANSFQIQNDNIYKYDTHTLTVQNAQVNGNNVYGILQGETDPTETTVGAVGQFYLNTASKALWQCVAITTTTDATTYTWQQVGGSTEKKYLHVINFWVTSPYNFGAGNYHLEIISSIKDPIGTTTIDLAKFLYDNEYRSGYIDTSTVNSKGPCIVSNHFAAVSTDSGSSLARTLGLYGQFSAISETYVLYATTDLIQGNKATIKINNNQYNVLQSLYDYASTSEDITNKVLNKIVDTVVEL